MVQGIQTTINTGNTKWWKKCVCSQKLTIPKDYVQDYGSEID